jgi:cbb3-type cytochrome oxidase subunit 1
MYYIVPRLLGLGAEAWCPKLTKWHFGLTLAGILISYLALLVAGVEQGIMLAGTDHSFVEVMGSTLLPLRASTLGDLLFLAGTFVFLGNFLRVIGTWCCEFCRRAIKEAK